MKKLAKVSPGVTAGALVGPYGQCPEDHFTKNVEGKVLSIQWETKNLAGVTDAEGDQWTINRTDLTEIPFNTVGQEQINGRMVSNG